MTVMLNKTDWSLFFLLFAAINNTGGQLKCLKMIANHCHRLNLSCFGDTDEFEEITFYIVKRRDIVEKTSNSLFKLSNSSYCHLFQKQSTISPDFYLLQ